MSVTKYKVGQSVVVHWHDRYRTDRDFVITRVGRKWVYLQDDYRFDAESMVIDGGRYPSPGRVYESREVYEAAAALQDKWSAMRFRVERTYTPPTGVTIEDIEQAARLLGIDLEKQ